MTTPEPQPQTPDNHIPRPHTPCSDGDGRSTADTDAHDGGRAAAGEGQLRVQAARLWIARHRPYYAEALFSCPITYTTAIEGFAIDPQWRIYINPHTAAALTTEEVAGSLVHELNHALRAHPERAQRASVPDGHHTAWNIAADCEINDDLRSDGLARRDGVVYPADMGLQPGQLTEQYYQQLLQNAQTIEIPVICCESASRGPTGPNQPAGQPGLTQARKQQLRRHTAQAVLGHQNDHGHWSVSKGLARWAQTTTAQTADWRRILAAALRRGLNRQPGTGDWTYTRPPRRPDDGPIIRPGTNRPTAHIAVVIDTSGSMTRKDHQQALSETQAILKQAVPGQAIHVYSYDTEAHTAQTVFNTSQIQLVGGGGTDMSAAIETAAETKPRPAIIIVITDGYTDWPPTRPPANHSTVIAVLTDPDTHHAVPPWITHITATGP